MRYVAFFFRISFVVTVHLLPNNRRSSPPIVLSIIVLGIRALPFTHVPFVMSTFDDSEIQIQQQTSESQELYQASDRDEQQLPYNAPTGANCSIESDETLVRRWLAEKSSRTQEEYARDLEQFVDFVDLPLRYVTLGHLQEYREHLAAQEYAKSSIKRKLSAIKSIFTFGTKLRYFAHNVGAALTTPSVRNDRAQRILSEANLWAILRDETDLRNHVLLRLFYASGGRVSDVEDLRWRDLKDRPDLEGPDGRPGGQVTFFGKGDKTRAVTLYSKVWSLIVRLHEEEEAEGYGAPDDPVFRSQKGGCLSRSQIWRIVKKAATRAGVKQTQKTDADGAVKRDEDGNPILTSEVSPHWFRHAHASHALQKGADLALVRETLGHESIETTKTYLHAQPGKSSSYYVDEAPDFRE
jgi:integrase/recombinase XerD